MQSNSAKAFRLKYSNVALELRAIQTKFDLVESSYQTAYEDGLRIAKKVEHLQDAVRLCQLCMDSQAELRQSLETLVTALLNRVFPEYDLRFFFAPVCKAGTDIVVGLKPMIEEDGQFIREPSKSHGAGISEVIAFALRVAAIKILDQELSPVLVMDEPLGKLSPTKVPKVLEFLDELNALTSLQLIMVTHVPLSHRHTYTIAKQDGRASANLG